MPLPSLRTSSLILALAATASAAFGQTLSLLGIELATAQRAQLEQAALDAGAVRAGQDGPVSRFDATKMGLPGIQSLTVLFRQDKLVMAQYSSAPATSADRGAYMKLEHSEALRKLLAERYGAPQEVSRLGLGTGRPFAGQFIDDGKYAWKFDGGMKLEYEQPWGTSKPVTVSYFSPDLVAKVRAEAERADAAAVKSTSKALGSKL